MTKAEITRLQRDRDKMVDALRAIGDMTDNRSRVNMPDGESLSSFIRRTLFVVGEDHQPKRR